MENRGRILVFLIVLVGLFSTISISTIPVEANPLTTVTLELQEEQVEVDVSPGSDGKIEVDGTVNCKKYGPDPVEVYLVASSETGGASVVPPNHVFTGSSGAEQTEPFTVTTRVPMGYSCSATPIITVSGTYSQAFMTYSIPQVSVMLIILQYYEIQWGTKSDTVLVKAGEKAEIVFNVFNTGNGDDIFVIDFENRDFLNNNGFILPPPFEVQMQDDENKSISLEFSAPDEETGDYLAQVSVLSGGSLKTDSQEKSILLFKLKVIPKDIGEQIGSIITSPLIIVIIITVIAVLVFIKLRRGEKNISTEN